MVKKIIGKIIFIIGIISTLISCSASEYNTINQFELFNANHPYIQYTGRFDFSNPQKAVFDWSGVIISAKFEGTSCSVKLNDVKNEYAVIIDNYAPKIFKTDSAGLTRVAQNLKDGVHTISIQKRTEAFVGVGEFYGFVLDPGKNLVKPDDKPDRRIEFIGNSITCGFGVEGDSSDCHFSPETENANLSYASIISRELKADYSLIAYSGRGVVRNYGDSNKVSIDPMPSLYDRICFNDSLSRWDFSKWIPQVVVINLGTNDFSTKPYPDKNVFVNAYINLLNKVRALYPGVTIFCLSGPMLSEPGIQYIKELVKSDQKGKRNRDVFLFEIPAAMMTEHDWGCDMHPNVKGMLKIANTVAPEIRARMNW